MTVKSEKNINSLKIGIDYPKNREDKMINKEREILYFFAKEPWRGYTFTEIKNVSGKKSKSYISLVLKFFVKEGILTEKAVGTLPVYHLNTGSTKAQVFAGFVLEHYSWSKRHIPHKDMQKAMDKILAENFVFIIAGSYAKNKQRPESDIDVVVLIDDSAESRKVYAQLSHFCELNIPPIHLYVFRNKEFIEMLTNREANYGKAIVKDNLILKGGQVYLKLIDEAMMHGYRG